jgi:hypothetical protein
MMPMDTWVRALSRMPITEMMSMTAASTLPRMALSHLLPVGAPNTARMFGPKATTGLSGPMRGAGDHEPAGQEAQVGVDGAADPLEGGAAVGVPQVEPAVGDGGQDH